MASGSNTAERWWIYQRERFPVFGHGALIAAFSLSAVCYSSLLRGSDTIPTLRSALVAFVSCFLAFLQLRIADEFKDFQQDARYQPYRPVPRGLVTLRELAVIGVVGAVVQGVLALWLCPTLLAIILGVWLYMTLMSKEFFVRKWLKARPITYMWTHMLVMPLVDFYATACDWMGARAPLPNGLAWFIGVSFFNGFVIEIGRKIRAPQDEEYGVQTYSLLWGHRNAAVIWLGMLGVSGSVALVAAYRIGFLVPMLVVLGILLATAILVVVHFVERPVASRAKLLELTAGIWTLLLYLTLGAVPMAVRWWGAQA